MLFYQRSISSSNLCFDIRILPKRPSRRRLIIDCFQACCHRMYSGDLTKNSNQSSHSPVVQDVTPFLSAWQTLPYVFPSQPQTGAYSNVQGPSLIFDSSMQSACDEDRQKVSTSSKNKNPPKRSTFSAIMLFDFLIVFPTQRRRYEIKANKVIPALAFEEIRCATTRLSHSIRKI